LTSQSSGTSRDLPRYVWRTASSMRLAVCLLFGLLLCMTLASLVPQIPPGLAESSRTEWMALAAQRLGRLYPALSASGVLDMYHSPPFAALVAILVLNTAACMLKRARSLSHELRRGRLGALGTLITHLAVIAIVLSVATSHAFSWQHTAAPVAEGQTYSIPNRPVWSIRNDGLHFALDERQQTLGYTALVSLLQGGQLLRQGKIRPNAPLRVARAGVWLMSYEPGVAVQARGMQGQQLFLQNAGGQSSPGRVTASLNSGPAVFGLPSVGLEFLISAPQPTSTFGKFDLTVRMVSTGELLLNKEVKSGVDVEVGEFFLTLRTAPDAIYGVKHDPATTALLLSALALAMGTSLSLFSGKGYP